MSPAWSMMRFVAMVTQAQEKAFKELSYEDGSAGKGWFPDAWGVYEDAEWFLYIMSDLYLQDTLIG